MVLVDREAFQNVLVGQGVPGGPVVENPSCNAGDTGSIPGLGRSHVLRDNRTQAPQLLRPSAATTEPVPTTRETTEMRSLCAAAGEELPLVATRERPCAATKTQRSQKVNKINVKEKECGGGERL